MCIRDSESIIGHWDGYPGNANNFFVYDDPTSKKLVMLPWGPDAAFSPVMNPASVLAHSALTHRLYNHPEGKRRYLAKAREILDGPFDEAALKAEIDRVQLLLGPKLAGNTEFGPALDGVRAFIDGRRAMADLELAMGGVTVDPLRAQICLVPMGELETTFSTTFGTHPTANSFLTGTGTFRSTGMGALTGGMTGSASGFGQSMDDAGQAVTLVVSAVGPGDYAVVYLVMSPDRFVPGTTGIDAGAVRGALLRYRPGAIQPEVIGYFFLGQVDLASAAMTGGAPVVGSVHTRLFTP